MGRRILIGLAIVVLLVAAASQLLVPPLTSDRVADRLTENGGTADVSVEAFPAARLLFGDGEEITVDARDVDLELPSEPGTLEKLDGFDRVDVRISESSAGPFRLANLSLTRSGSEPYRFTLTGGTSTNELIDFGADQLGLFGGTALRFLGRQALEENRPIPMRIDMELTDEDGRLRIVSGGGTIAGVPTGPLAQLITSAIVIRL